MTIGERLDKTLNLARKEKQTKPPLAREEGVTVSQIDNYLEDEVERTEPIEIVDYRKMRHNDATIRAMYQLFTLPILASSHTFEPAEGGETEAEFLTDVIEKPPHLGGMTTPFQLFLKDQLRAVEDGYRVFYKVYGLNDNGQIIYKKLSPRDTPDLTIQVNEKGGFKGVRQQVWAKGKTIDVDLDVDHLYMFTFQKEMNPLYGESLYRTARYHYNRKRRYYVLQELQAQVAAIPPRKLKTPANADKDVRTIAERAADRFAVRQRITLPEGYDLEEYKTTPMDVQNAINHHDTSMARSVLAQFMMLGAESKTGSFSLSRDQSDLLLMSLESLQKELAAHMNSYLFPELIDYNFTSKAYPTFKFAGLSDRTKQITTDAFNEMLRKGDAPDYVKEGIAKDMATELGIDIPDEAEIKRAAEEDEKKLKKTRDSELSRNSAGVKLGRSLNEAEKRINLKGIKGKFDSAEKNFNDTAEDIFTRMKDDAIKRSRRLVEKDGLSGLKDFKPKYLSEYKKLVKDTMLDVYNANKKYAADELSIGAPQTPATTREFITQQAQMVTEKIEEDVLFAIKSEYAKEQRRASLSITDAIARIGAALETILTGKVTLAATASISMAMNVARQDVFKSVDDRVAVYEYSAILDNRTSALCRELDGMVLNKEQYAASPWKPPVHFNCRSIWVAILKEDSFIPDVTGEVEKPAGYDAPQLSRALDKSEELETLEYYIEEVTSLSKTVEEVKKQSDANKVDQKKLAELEQILSEV